jgi:HK97 gp10 family phage protein
MIAETQVLHGLEGVLAALQSLPQEIVSKNGGVVRKALRKASLPVRDQAKANVQRIIAEDHGLDPTLPESTGALLQAIGTVKARNPEAQFGPGFKEAYIVKVRKAPRVRNMTPAHYGRVLEFGSEKETARPWMTPAYYATRQLALDTFVAAMTAGVAVAIQKAAALGRTGA